MLFSTSASEYLHLRVDSAIKPGIGHPLADVGIELGIADLVAFLVLAVAGEILLDGVVGEMHAAGADVQRVFRGSSAHVALEIPVAFELAVDAGHQHVVAQVELALAVQEGPLDVRLDYVRSLAAVPPSCSLLYHSLHVA